MAPADADVVVLGGGPGGYAVALRAALRGQSVAVVEAGKVGGTCLHAGCIPSKAMLHVGAVLDEARDAQRLGLDLAVRAVDVEGIGAFRDGVVERMHRGLAGLLRTRGVRVVEGYGRCADDARTVLVGEERVTAGSAVVVATGSRVRSLPGVEVDGRVVVTSEEAVGLPRVPRRALVVGAGAVGLEFASLWRSLGAEEVTIVEALDRIAPLEDADLSEALATSLRRRGITTLAPATVDAVTVDGDLARVTVTRGDDVHDLTVDTVLLAIGRVPCTDGIGLQELGVLDGHGHVRVDAWQATPVQGVYAVGDLLAPPSPALAHAAFAEGFVAADVIAGERAVPVDPTHVPRVTYCSPEVASVGLSEEAAREAGRDVTATRYSLRGNAKGAITGSDGFVKVVAEAGGEVLGVHVIGPHATDLIAEAQLITAWGALPSEVAQLVHPHPTLAEAMGEAHLAAAGFSFHSH